MIIQDLCYEKLPGHLDHIVASQIGLEGLVDWSTSMHIFSWVPWFVALLAGVGLILSLVTPVPELYSSHCVDPEPRIFDNSMASPEPISKAPEPKMKILQVQDSMTEGLEVDDINWTNAESTIFDFSYDKVESGEVTQMHNRQAMSELQESARI